MFYLQKNCGVCRDGLLGFLLCSDAKTVVVMCEECSSVWLTPDELEQPPIVTEAPRYLLPESDVSISGGSARWASFQEIDDSGMSGYASREREYIR